MVVVFLLLSSTVETFAQNGQANIDSLANSFVQQEQVDLKTFDILFKELHQMYPEELALLAEILLKRSVQQDVMDGVYRAHDAFGVYFISKGYYNQAFQLLLRAKDYYEKTDNLSYKMKNYYYIGRYYAGIGSLSESFFWMEKSLALAEMNPERSSLYNVRNDLATLYFKDSNFVACKKLIDLNVKEWEQLGKEIQVNTKTLEGNYLMHKGNKKEAKISYDAANKLAFETDNKVMLASTFTNLGIFEYEYDQAKSKDYFESSLYYSKLSNYNEKIASDYYNLAFWHVGVNEIDSALYYFESSYNTAEKVKSYSNMLDALQEMIQIHRNQKNWTKVDDLHKKVQSIKNMQYEELMQSFEDLNMFEAFNSFTTKEIQKDDNQLKILGLELSKDSLWLLVFLVTLSILQALALFWLYKR